MEKTRINSKKDHLINSIYNLEKIKNQSIKYYSSRNSPRSHLKSDPNQIFHDNSAVYMSNIQVAPLKMQSNIEPSNTIKSYQTSPKTLRERIKIDEKQKIDKKDNEGCEIDVKRRGQIWKKHRISEAKKSKKYLLNQTISTQFKLTPNNNNITVHEFDKIIAENKMLKDKSEKLVLQKAQLVQILQTLKKKLKIYQTNISEYSLLIQPYQNNVIVMEQKLNIIKSFFQKYQQKVTQQEALNKRKIGEAQNKNHNNLNYEFQLLKITQQRQNRQYQQKINRLNCVIQELHNKLKLSKQNQDNMRRQINCLNTIINEGTYLRRIKQRLLMTEQQLYQYKIYYKETKKQKLHYEKINHKMKDKICLLTSLIGYGVVTSVQNNDICDLDAFKLSLDKKTGVQQKQVNDTYGMLTLRKNKSALKLMHQQMMNPVIPSPCLYLPNFLVFYNDENLRNVLQDSTTIVIKPQFFLLIRAIFDSKYSDYVMNRRQVMKFPDFVLGYLDIFRVKKNHKRIELNPNLTSKISSLKFEDNTQMAKSSFFIKIFDKKIGSLLQIMTFKQFLLKNVPEDEVFYYLMCRNALLKGPQLNNYINCSDAMTYVRYEHAHLVVMQLLQKYDKQSKMLIINHLNTKKVLKNKKVLVKNSYVLKLLLEVYRKHKYKKTLQLKYIFDEFIQACQNKYPDFPIFFQLIYKNFPFLTRGIICTYYRKTIGIFNCQNDTTFFQIFNAACLSDIFFRGTLIKDQQLKKRFNTYYDKRTLNYMFQLIPQSIYQLGNEQIYRQFNSLTKLKQLGIEDHVRISGFFSKIMLSQISNFIEPQIYGSKSEPQTDKKVRNNVEAISQLFIDFNNSLIDLLNKNLKRRQQYENSINQASLKIGRFYRNKTREFYTQFIADINNQIFSPNNLKT